MIKLKKQRLFLYGTLNFVLIVLLFYFLIKERPPQNKPELKDEEIRYRMKGHLCANDSGLVSYISRHYLHPPALKYNNVFNKISPNRLAHNRSSFKFIQSILKKLFQNEPPGFFIEAGAFDGEFFSNTLWLEKKKGWTGLLIEPNPTNYAALLKLKRRAWSSRSCLSTSSYPTENVFTVVDPSYDTTNSIDIRKTLVQVLRSQTYEIEKGISTLDSFQPYFASNFVYITAQCFPLESFMLALNVSVVDFLSLDIQGGEWEVLELFPWDKIKLRTLSVEYLKHKDKTPNKNKSFIGFMNSKGYKLIGVSHTPDYIFVHQNETKLLAKVLILQNF